MPKTIIPFTALLMAAPAAAIECFPNTEERPAHSVVLFSAGPYHDVHELVECADGCWTGSVRVSRLNGKVESHLDLRTGAYLTSHPWDRVEDHFESARLLSAEPPYDRCGYGDDGTEAVLRIC